MDGLVFENRGSAKPEAGETQLVGGSLESTKTRSASSATG
jgi:hypothetical protein